MAGLLLADKTAALEDKGGAAEARQAELRQELENVREKGAEVPKRVRCRWVPTEVTETLAGDGRPVVEAWPDEGPRTARAAG